MPQAHQKLYEAVTAAARDCANAKTDAAKKKATKTYNDALQKYHAAINRRGDTQPSPKPPQS